MVYQIISEVNLAGLIFTDEYKHDFGTESNVFGRVLEYHKRMAKVFPNRPYRLIKATLIEEDK